MVSMVPTPASVSSSVSREWDTLPSRMTAEPTPERTLSTQQSTLGIIPPEITPSRTKAGTEDSWREGIKEDSSSGLWSRPRTSVRRISFSASRETASLAAAVSALTL